MSWNLRSGMHEAPQFSAAEERLFRKALREAKETRVLAIENGVRQRVAQHFDAVMGRAKAIVISDRRIDQIAGREVQSHLESVGLAAGKPILLPEAVPAEMSFVDRLVAQLQTNDAIPVAVGSGTINDLTKLAASRVGRDYLVVATAASMDGYTAFGASITEQGSKQTFACPAPRAVLADLEIICRAPVDMNAAGYADLLAKGVAGADWILANAAGIELIDPVAWPMVQDQLPAWVSAPEQIAAGHPQSIFRLTWGLMMTGLAMQATRSSRPASGAEHQFSHLWDMQHHTYLGLAPSHGFKVGIGSLASLRLYQFLLKQDWRNWNLPAVASAWPSWDQTAARVVQIMGAGELGEKALEETNAKYPDQQALLRQLRQLQDQWPDLRQRLERHLQPFLRTAELLQAAGAPSTPEQIGISQERLRASYEQAAYLRRRFTILDLIMRLGLFEKALDALFPMNPPAARSGAGS